MNEEQVEDSFQSFFVEANEVKQLIHDLVACSQKKDAVSLQKNTDSIIRILEKYQEQGQLLDPHLEDMVSKLTQIAEQVFGLSETLIPQCTLEKARQAIFKVLYVLTKVRGYKTVLKLFSHEITHLEVLFHTYVKMDKAEWETRYILLLWLSLIVINPFPFSVVDSSRENTLVTQMIDEMKQALSESGKPRDSAALFMGRLLTRPDLSATQLPKFLSWSSDQLQVTQDTFLKAGIYLALVEIFRQGKRDELLDKIPTVFTFAVSDAEIENTTIRQLSVKLAQRIALIYLKPRIVSWRYQKSRMSLLQNLGYQASIYQSNSSADEDDDIDVPEDIEAIIEKLLNGLRDKDTVVRWSAAKGIGRITMRLTRDFGDDVVESVLSLLSFGETDSAWHGGCLALAELARRGLLLPTRLDVVVPLILKALEFDERKGTYSVGANVRDAACYVCWAFARAYAPQVMTPHVADLAVGLIKTAVFDREVNCRRAAAAAFQENVGRQGNFPHGIDVLTKADYFTLCNRITSYEEISHYIAQFPEYCQSLIDHLIKVKASHWDRNIRGLTAKTLYKLCDRDPAYMAKTALPYLIPNCFSSDLNTRHGSLIATADIILGLGDLGYKINDETLADLSQIVPTIEAKQLYKGRGGEIIREGICRLIECLALSRNPLQKLNIFQDIIEVNLKHPNEEIIAVAVRAFKAFTNEYYRGENVERGKTVATNIIKLLQTDRSPAARRGGALALGSLPPFLIDADMFENITHVLTENIRIEQDPALQDVESRRNSVRGLIDLCTSVGLGPNGVNNLNSDKICDAILSGTEDYAIDKRGDIGSIVREASMLALEKWAKLLSSSDQGELLTQNMSEKIVVSILKQSVEKIDRVRDTAGCVLQRLLTCDCPINIPHKEALLKLIQSQNLIDWSSAECTFPILVQCLSLSEYRYGVLSGLVTSVGGLSSHVFKYSSEALVKYLKQNRSSPVLIEVAHSIVQLLQESHQNDRVVVPLLKTTAHILSHNCLDAVTPDKNDFSLKVIASVSSEMRTTKNIQKLFMCVDTLCELLRFENPAREKALQRLFISGLASRFPKVRDYASQQLLGALQVADIIQDDDLMDEILDILANTEWLETIDAVKLQVDQLYTLLQVPKPVFIKRETAVVQPQTQQSKDESYSDLVKHTTGY